VFGDRGAFREHVVADTPRNRRIGNAIFSFVLKEKEERSDSSFFGFYDGTKSGCYLDEIKNADEWHDINDILKDYPKNLAERIDASLLNLARLSPGIGMKVEPSCPILYCESDNGQMILEYFEQRGWLKGPQSLSSGEYEITMDGWLQIEELQRKTSTINQAFLAMKFGNETDEISNCFKECVEICGYAAKRIDEHQHNNQIVPEILFQIKQSKFMVVDMTFPNYGAYYETEFAHALGKEVIVCCKDTELEKVHFDIAQKNMVVWKDAADLSNRLVQRIEATIGRLT
jgi:hypothetical protein